MVGKHDKRWLICASCMADDVINWQSPKVMVKEASENKDKSCTSENWSSPCTVNMKDCPYGLKKYRYVVLCRNEYDNFSDMVRSVMKIPRYVTCQGVVCVALNKKEATLIAKHLLKKMSKRASGVLQTKEAQKFAKENNLDIYHDNFSLKKDTYRVADRFFQGKKPKSIAQLASVAYPNIFSNIKSKNKYPCLIKDYYHKSSVADYKLNGMRITTIRFRDITRIQIGVNGFYLLTQFGIIDKMNKRNFKNTITFLYNEAKKRIERYELGGQVIFYGDKELLYFLNGNEKIFPQDPQYTLENLQFSDYKTLSSIATPIPW